jgi:hypothetical protein
VPGAARVKLCANCAQTLFDRKCGSPQSWTQNWRLQWFWKIAATPPWAPDSPDQWIQGCNYLACFSMLVKPHMTA